MGEGGARSSRGAASGHPWVRARAWPWRWSFRPSTLAAGACPPRPLCLPGATFTLRTRTGVCSGRRLARPGPVQPQRAAARGHSQALGGLEAGEWHSACRGAEGEAGRPTGLVGSRQVCWPPASYPPDADGVPAARASSFPQGPYFSPPSPWRLSPPSPGDRVRAAWTGVLPVGPVDSAPARTTQTQTEECKLVGRGRPGLCRAAEIPSLVGTWALGGRPHLAPPPMTGAWGWGISSAAGGPGEPSPRLSREGQGLGRPSASSGWRGEWGGLSPAPPDPPCSPLGNEAGRLWCRQGASPCSGGLGR